MTSKLPEFPKFEPITIDHHAAIREITDKFPPYADFNPVNLQCWNVGEGVKVSNLEGNLVFQLPDYISNTTLVSMLGEHEVDASLQELLDINGRLDLVPEVVVEQIEGRDNFTIIEDVDGHDYVYLVQRIVGLNGRLFRKKRQALGHVESELGDSLEVVSKKEIDKQDKQDMRDLFKAWIEGKAEEDNVYLHEEEEVEAAVRAREQDILDILRNEGKDRQSRPLEENTEFVAFNTLLANVEQFENVAFTLVRMDGQLVAFSVNEIINNVYALCHFEKAARVPHNLGVLVVREAAKYLQQEGCELVNWEQDLGLPGLRKTKSSYQPDFHLRKFSIFPGEQ